MSDRSRSLVLIVLGFILLVLPVTNALGDSIFVQTWLRPSRVRSAFSLAGDEFITPSVLTGGVFLTIL